MLHAFTNWNFNILVLSEDYWIYRCIEIRLTSWLAEEPREAVKQYNQWKWEVKTFFKNPFYLVSFQTRLERYKPNNAQTLCACVCVLSTYHMEDVTAAQSLRMGNGQMWVANNLKLIYVITKTYQNIIKSNKNVAGKCSCWRFNMKK